jgi:hypothetical protein
MVTAPPLRHVHCTPGPSKVAGSSVSRTLGDIERPRYNAFLQKRRLPVHECAVRALLPPEAKPFRVRVRTAPAVFYPCWRCNAVRVLHSEKTAFCSPV